ncbi:HD domain-containing phosphohydrolase [Thalassobacillus pellis]|uniref:HD domain-containing phosphohydrolase n=1 Tax=Thalassobacillus pellis TaxID=748008 RepID=UPI001960F64B|nr:HD-GYP domain-containing protein (c-di-GMP phosphodiesterase class II) [Thalassobacillus pellis]
MRVHPTQIIPGCIITRDVIGKTNRPLVPKNTVVQDIHIKVLQKFMVPHVEVGPKLSSGDPFFPEYPMEEAETAQKAEMVTEVSFTEKYLQAVKDYRKWFNNWQGGAPVDIQQIRDRIMPLLEFAKGSKKDIFQLHHFSTKNDYLFHHSVAVSVIAAFLGEKLKLSHGACIQLGLAGLLSDCGMAKVDKRLHFKQEPLSEEEYKEVKRHPTYSYRMIENTTALSHGAKLGILQHHERLDGSGYPLGSKGKKIHQFAKIIAVSDMYHAMTSERPYRKKQSPFKVLEEMIQAQFGQFELTVVQMFIDSMTNYSTGTKVKLSDGQTAEIIFVESAQPTRPMVRLENNDIIQLKEFQDIFIEEILD